MSRVITTFTTVSCGSPSRPSKPPDAAPGVEAPWAAAAAAPAAADAAARSARCWQGRLQDWQKPAAGGEPVAPSQKMAGAPNVRTVATLATGRIPLQVVDGSTQQQSSRKES
jgi:hypothetical protein